MSERKLKVDVVNAEKSLFHGEAEFVALPGIEGELGILPGHTPLITLIKPGLTRIREEKNKKEVEIFIAGGVLEIQPYKVIVLADVAIRSEDLDEKKAREAMERAKEASKNATTDMEIAKIQAEIGMLAEELRILQDVKSNKH
ncbi:MAG: F0F1 ATP synthase subunit epsilon [Burkholderiales bacterium]|nr:F0F1 ATP synthase subunit epsilon [Burkholderiales bacterium]